MAIITEKIVKGAICNYHIIKHYTNTKEGQTHLGVYSYVSKEIREISLDNNLEYTDVTVKGNWLSIEEAYSKLKELWGGIDG